MRGLKKLAHQLAMPVLRVAASAMRSDPIYSLVSHDLVWSKLFNARGYLAHCYYRRDLSEVQRKILVDLRRDGLAKFHIKELLPNLDLESLQSQLDNKLNAPDVKQRIERARECQENRIKGQKLYQVRLYDPPKNKLEAGDGFLDLAFNPRVLEVVNAYFGFFARIPGINIWYDVPVGANQRRSSQNWHRDPEDKKLIKAFLYLTNVGPETGPFNYVLGSQEHHGRSRNTFRRRRVGMPMYPPQKQFDAVFKDEQIAVCTGGAGTMILCDTTGLHRGGFVVGNSPRVLFHSMYTSKGIPLISKTSRKYDLAECATNLSTPEQRYAARA